jgi:muramoyltetrapeptide carboxypeptidase LdcA involved in peptidoglycan recycling
MGFGVVYGPSVDAVFLHTAGTSVQRYEDLNWAIHNSEIDVIMSFTGGFNTNQLLPYLTTRHTHTIDKVLIGYSDFTALLITAYQHRLFSKLIHGPSFATLCDPNLFDYTRDALSATLDGKAIIYRCPGFASEGKWYEKPGFGPRDIYPYKSWKIFHAGSGQGRIIGGNLATICALLGTPYFPDLSRCLVFLEDTTGAQPGRFHRSMTQLSQAGVFRDVTGVIIGKVPKDSALNNRLHMEYILDDIFGMASFPVIYDVNCSHIDPKMSIPLGAIARLDTESMSLEILGDVKIV